MCRMQIFTLQSNSEKPSHFQKLRITHIMRSFALFVERTWRTLKYEWLFLKDYHEFDELEQSLNEFVYYFNHKRIHQSLDYQTPDEVYKQGTFPNINNEKVA